MENAKEDTMHLKIEVAEESIENLNYFTCPICTHLAYNPFQCVPLI